LGAFSLLGNDIGFRVNGKLNLIEGIIEDEAKTTYELIYNPIGNPQAQGWYVLNN